MKTPSIANVAAPITPLSARAATGSSRRVASQSVNGATTASAAASDAMCARRWPSVMQIPSLISGPQGTIIS